MSIELTLEDSYEVINGRKVVKKHVATIHCSNKLSLLERKISNALLFHAYPNLKKTLIHEISLENLKRLLNSVTRNHKALKAALKTLISTVIEWNILGDKVPELDLEGWNASTILSSVSISDGKVKYQYSELIKELIVDPSIYGKINLLIQAKFTSSYALALYENCARYRGLKYTKEFLYPLFRKLMGVEEGKYEQFRDFNRRVLTPAITEINTRSDIFIVSDITRRGRKIHSIKFSIEERPIKKRLGKKIDRRENEEEKGIMSLLQAFGLKNTRIKSLIAKFGKERVIAAAHYVQSKQKCKTREIKNLAGYLVSAIEDGYVDTVLPQEKRVPLRQQSEIKRGVHIEQELWEAYGLYKVKQCQRIFGSLNVKKQNEIEVAFIEGKHNYRTRNTKAYYETLGINNILVFESGLVDYLLKECPELMTAVMDFDEFVKNQNT